MAENFSRSNETPENKLEGEEDLNEGSLSWAEKREKIFKSLEFRVESSVDLKNVLEEISLEDSDEKVSAKLAECFEKQKHRFSSETIKNFERFKELQKQVEEVRNRIDRIEDSYEGADGELNFYKLTKDEGYTLASEKLEALFGEISPLEEDLDIEFLAKFENIVKDLSEKNKHIKGVLATGGEDQFKKDYLALLAGRKNENILDYNDIKKVTVEPFDVIFDIDKEDKDGSWGLYHGNSAFISIFPQKKSQMGFTIDHEKVHNVLNSVEMNQKHRDFDGFKMSYKTYRRLEDLDAPSSIIENQISILKRYNGLSFIDEHHEEIVAAIEEASFMGFKRISREARLLNYMFGKSENVEDGFYQRTAVFFTAGNRVEGNDKKLVSMIAKEKNPETKKMIEDLKAKFEFGFVNMAQQIEEATKIAEAIGSEAKKELDILVLMLQPTKYRHIKSYFENKYGKENVDRMIENRNFIDNFSFTMPEMKNLFAKIGSGEIILTEDDKDFLSDELDNFEPGADFEKLKMNSLEDAEEYIFLSKRLCEMLRGQEPDEKFVEAIYAQLFYNIFGDSIENQFSDLPEIYEKLNEAAKKYFEETFKSYLESFIDEDLEKSGIEISSIEDIKNLPLWNVIVKIGLEKSALDTIHKIKERQLAWEKKQKEKNK